MLINVAQQEFGTAVHCGSPSTDGYEVENILNRSSSTGFLCSYFVKPPCDIILSFPFPVNIQSIGISPRVSTTCTEVVSVFVSDKTYEEVSSNTRDSHYTCFHYCGTFSDLHLQEKAIVYMVNPTFKPTSKFGKYAQGLKSGEKFIKNLPLMGHVKLIKLRINRVVKFGPPCLKYVEVLGHPSEKCTNENLNFVLSKLELMKRDAKADQTAPNKEIFKPLPLFASTGVDFIQKPSISQTETKSSPPNEQNEDIPTNFLDPITLDIMTDPVIVPSGHTIDRATILRCTTDPFTGLSLNLNDVIPNHSLMSEISSFLESRKRKSDFIESNSTLSVNEPKFVPFSGKGYRLGGGPPSKTLHHHLVDNFVQDKK
jgi:U-box domain-containing protein 5